MIISLPNDGKGFLYHVVDLDGHTVHAYRDETAAIRSMIGDQRMFAQVEATGRWVANTPPGPAKG